MVPLTPPGIELTLDIQTWAVSPRGAGWLFGDKVALEVPPSPSALHVETNCCSSITLTIYC
jgi:hypothetical protein